MDGRFLKVNRPLCEMLGYSTEEFLTQDFTSITRREDLATSFENMRQWIAAIMVRGEYHGQYSEAVQR
jgi:PAS domain S-box-containing protein